MVERVSFFQGGGGGGGGVWGRGDFLRGGGGSLSTMQPTVTFHVETKPNNEFLYEMKQWGKMG